MLYVGIQLEINLDLENLKFANHWKSAQMGSASSCFGVAGDEEDNKNSYVEDGYSGDDNDNGGGYDDDDDDGDDDDDDDDDVVRTPEVRFRNY